MKQSLQLETCVYIDYHVDMMYDQECASSVECAVDSLVLYCLVFVAITCSFIVQALFSS